MKPSSPSGAAIIRVLSGSGVNGKRSRSNRKRNKTASAGTSSLSSIASSPRRAKRRKRSRPENARQDGTRDGDRRRTSPAFPFALAAKAFESAACRDGGCEHGLRRGAGVAAAFPHDFGRRPDRTSRRQRQWQIDVREACRGKAESTSRQHPALIKTGGGVLCPASNRRT